MATTLKLLAVLLLVAAEFALAGVRVSRIETLVAAGSRSARRLVASLALGRIERVEKRRLKRVKLEIVHITGEREREDELDRARSST